MKRLLLLSLLFFSFGLSADTSKSKTINNLTVTVHGGKALAHGRDFVEVYKGDKHVFSFDCNEMYLCNIFTTSKDEPSLVMESRKSSISRSGEWSKFGWTSPGLDPISITLTSISVVSG